MTLRSRTIKLAHENPDLRPHLLPVLAKTSAKTQPWMFTMTTNGVPKTESFVPMQVPAGRVLWTVSVPEGAIEPDPEQDKGILVGVAALRWVRKDPAVLPLMKLVDEFQPTFPAVPGKPSFAVSAKDRGAFLTKMRELGWGMEDQAMGRRVFVHLTSLFKIVQAEGDSFIIGLTETPKPTPAP